jgi:hypothetical protein
LVVVASLSLLYYVLARGNGPVATSPESTSHKQLEPDCFDLAGRVIDDATTAGLPDVNLCILEVAGMSVEAPSSRTDANGLFQFKGIPGPKRQIRLQASKPGYEESLTDVWLGVTEHIVTLSPEKDK